MQFFYTTDIQGDQAFFSEEEARHAVQVLRHKKGDELTFVDGKGTLYHGVITETGKRKCILQIQSKEEHYHPRPFHLAIAISPPKNIARMEWFLEKAVEIGVDHIIPIACQHSERSKLRQERLDKVLLSAMKQSLSAYLPQLESITPLRELLERTDLPSQRYIAHCEEGDKMLLGKDYPTGAAALVLIGPEGDFSKEEIQLAIEKGFVPVTLGESRLRIETAAVATCTIMNYLNEK